MFYSFFFVFFFNAHTPSCVYVVSSEGAEGKEKGGGGGGKVVEEKPGVKSVRVFLLLICHEVTGLCNI